MTTAVTLAAVTLRTSYRRLLGWVIVIAVLLTGTAAGVDGVYPTAADRQVYAEIVGRSAATAALNGRGYDLDHIGGIVTYEFGFFASLLLPVVAGHLAIHLTRTQEDRGLFELITAGPIDRLTPLRVAVVLVAQTIVVTWALCAAGLIAVGLPVTGSLLHAAGLALLMATFAAVGFVAGQLASGSRTAHAVLLGAVGVAYLVRAVVDGRDLPLTWLTPTGWLAELRPYGPWRPWPLVGYALATLALTGAALAVAARRDLGSGVLSSRSGPARAAGWLRSVPALAHRLTRASWLGWTIGAVAWGFGIGLLAPEMTTLVEDNPAVADALGGAGAVDDLLASMGLLVVALLSVGALLQWLTALASEESSGRLGAVTAGPTARGRWWWGSLVVVGVETTVVLAAGATGQVVGTGMVEGRWSPGLLADAAAYLPAVVLVGAVAAAAQAIRAGAVAVGWALLAWVSVVALLGETLGLPRWFRQLSPFELVGRPPVDAVAPGTMVIIASASTVLLAVGWWALRRRDLSH
ncbi:MAG: ABC transporter permease [Acidimicrobiales bacterium]